MKTRKILATTAIAITALLGIGASASAATLTPTKVTIKGSNGDYYGYVKSDKGSCEAGRTVKVYKLQGATPHPADDLLIGSDIAQPNGPDSMWAIGNSGYKHGKFYARVAKTSKCGGDLSKVIER